MFTNIFESLWAMRSMDTGYIRKAEPLEVEIDTTMSLPKLPQYPLKPVVTEGFRPFNDFIKGPCPYSILYNTLILPVKKPNKKKYMYRLIKNLWAVNETVNLRFLLVANLIVFF